VGWVKGGSYSQPRDRAQGRNRTSKSLGQSLPVSRNRPSTGS
jgi:hypothetical protein